MKPMVALTRPMTIGAISAGAEAAHLDAGKNIGDDHQTRGADQPVEE